MAARTNGYAHYSLEDINYRTNSCYYIIQGSSDKMSFTRVKEFVREVVISYFKWCERKYGQFAVIEDVTTLIYCLCILDVEKIHIFEIDPLGTKTCDYFLNLFVPDILNYLVKKGFLRRETYKKNIGRGMQIHYRYIQIKSFL